jgi:hypothetical protein
MICSAGLSGSKFLTVHHRAVSQGRRFEVLAGDDYHLVYVIEAPKAGVISFSNFHRYVAQGILPADWAGDTNELLGRFGE